MANCCAAITTVMMYWMAMNNTRATKVMCIWESIVYTRNPKAQEMRQNSKHEEPKESEWNVQGGI